MNMFRIVLSHKLNYQRYSEITFICADPLEKLRKLKFETCMLDMFNGLIMNVTCILKLHSFS